MKYLMCLLLLFSSLLKTVAAEPVLLTGGHIIDVKTGRVVEGSILISDGRISRISTGEDASDGADVIDMTGKFLMPGLIDAHSHGAASALLVPNQAPGSLMRSVPEKEKGSP